MRGDESEMRSEGVERELDAALARYGAAEPRAGLEGRIIANLRQKAEAFPQGLKPSLGIGWILSELKLRPPKRQVVSRSVWALAGVAIVLAVAALMWRSGNVSPSAGAAAQETEAIAVRNAPVAANAQVAQETSGAVAPPHRQQARHAAAKAPEREPKLEQFPSPEPLSEQEKLMIRYAADDRDALLVAQARADELKQEMEDQGAE